jgi:hypothetical protein
MIGGTLLNLRTEIKFLRSLIAENSRLIAYATRVDIGRPGYSYYADQYFGDSTPRLGTRPPEQPQRGQDVTGIYWRRFIEHLESQQGRYHQRLHQLEHNDGYVKLKQERVHLETAIHLAEERLHRLNTALETEKCPESTSPPAAKRARLQSPADADEDVAQLMAKMGRKDNAAMVSDAAHQSSRSVAEVQAICNEHSAEMTKVEQLLIDWRRNHLAMSELRSPAEGAINLGDFIIGHQCTAAMDAAANSIQS